MNVIGSLLIGSSMFYINNNWIIHIKKKPKLIDLVGNSLGTQGQKDRQVRVQF